MKVSSLISSSLNGTLHWWYLGFNYLETAIFFAFHIHRWKRMDLYFLTILPFVSYLLPISGEILEDIVDFQTITCIVSWAPLMYIGFSSIWSLKYMPIAVSKIRMLHKKTRKRFKEDREQIVSEEIGYVREKRNTAAWIKYRY